MWVDYVMAFGLRKLEWCPRRVKSFTILSQYQSLDRETDRNLICVSHTYIQKEAMTIIQRIMNINFCRAFYIPKSDSKYSANYRIGMQLIIRPENSSIRTEWYSCHIAVKLGRKRKNVTSCRRAAATVCPRPSPPRVGAEALCAAEQTAT